MIKGGFVQESKAPPARGVNISGYCHHRAAAYDWATDGKHTPNVPLIKTILVLPKALVELYMNYGCIPTTASRHPERELENEGYRQRDRLAPRPRHA